MRKLKMLLLLFVLAGPLALFAQTAPSRLVFPQHRFSIIPLEEPAAGNYVLLFMNLPSTENFSPNINIMVQQYAGSLEEFKLLSETQFIEQKWILIRSELRNNGILLLEYAGRYNDLDMHWYSRVLKREGQVFLVTGTARESQWKQVSSKLVDVVDSFVLEK